MGMNKFRRYSIRGLRRSLMLGVGVGVLGSAAVAQIGQSEAPLKLQSDYLGYAAGVSARVGYTDNINLSRSGLKDGETYLSTQFTGGAIVSTPRVTALVLADLDFSYLVDRSDLVINQNIGATSTFTVADNWVYVDISGQTTRQLIGDNARFSGNINSARNQQANVHSFNASPYVYRQMADQSSVELRYRFSQAYIDDGNSAANIFGGSFLNDSTSQEVVAAYETGNKFDRVRFRAVAYGARTEEDGSGVLPGFAYDQGSLFTEAQLAISRQFSLSGAIGYDDVETKQAASIFFSDDELSGVFWRAGITATPNRGSRIRLEYGERYGDDFIDADIFYELSKRLFISGGASRTFRTRAQGLNTQFRSVQTQTLDFADRLREGQELTPRSLISSANRFANTVGGGRSAQSIGVSVSDNAFAALSGVYDRTQITLSASVSDSDFGFRRIETYGVSLSLQHQLSRRLRGYGSVNYRRSDTTVDTIACEANPVLFGIDVADPLFNAVADCVSIAANNGVTNTVIGRLGGSYSIYKNVSGFAEVTHAERFSPISTLEYAENTAMVGLTLEF